MFIKAIPEKSSGRVLINLCTSTHLHGKQIQRTVRRIGYLDEFSDKYPDPIALFKEEARRMPPSTGKDDSPSFYVSTLLTKVHLQKGLLKEGRPKRAHVPLGQGQRVLVKRIQEASGFMLRGAVVLSPGMPIRQLRVRKLLQISQEGGDRQIPIQDVRAAQGLDTRLHRRILQFEEAPFIDRIHDPEREGCTLLRKKMILLVHFID